MDISFLLPTNRDHKYALTTINSINEIETPYKYEIIVCSPNKIKEENVVWHEDRVLKGPLFAFNEGYKISKGDIIVCIVDDHMVINNGSFFNFVDFVTSDFFREREFKITSLQSCSEATNKIAVVPQRIPILGEMWCGNMKETLNHRQHITTRFPVIQKETIENKLQQYIFHPIFKYHAGDLFLGFYMGEEEAPCTESLGSVLYQYAELRNYSFEQEDCRNYHYLKEKYIKGYKKYV